VKITPDLFAHYLKCSTKCWLHSRSEVGGGNEYADWVRTQNESYRHASAKRLLEGIPENERSISPLMTDYTLGFSAIASFAESHRSKRKRAALPVQPASA
jgi:hypothetical protein